MDGRLGHPTFQEAIEAERDSDEFVVGIQCHGCGYQLWTHVRPSVPTQIRCFREDCQALTLLNAERSFLTSSANPR